MEDFHEERKVGVQSDEYGPNGNNDSIILMSSYPNLYSKADISKNASC